LFFVFFVWWKQSHLRLLALLISNSIPYFAGLGLGPPLIRPGVKCHTEVDMASVAQAAQGAKAFDSNGVCFKVSGIMTSQSSLTACIYFKYRS
jgi:hypothetical protein